MSHGEERFFIGELARRSGTSRDAIRYYESRGVLPAPPRARSGYRLYRMADVERLSFIAQAKRLGLTLDEIAETLEIVDRGREPCDHVRRALGERLSETRRCLSELRALEVKLEEALAGAERGRVASQAACRCRIIEDAARGGGG